MSGEPDSFDVLVVGAGVVGMACARALQRAGCRVCVADPEAPGSGCSFGNAGLVAASYVVPLARGQTLRRLPAMMLQRNGPLYLKITRLPTLLPWFARFAAACLPSRVAGGACALAALSRRALPAWERELAASHGLGLLERRGMYRVYRSGAAFARDGRELSLARELGVDWEALDGETLRQREPALSPTLERAVHFPDVAHVLSPQGVVRCLADAFAAADGGRLLAREVRALTCEPHRVTARLEHANVRARYAVVAAGLLSRPLCRSVGYDPPLVAEMGYHVTFPAVRRRLRAPIGSAEGGFVATPMDDHLRVAGTVEFARRERPPAWHRAAVLRRRAAELFRDPLPEPVGRWRGSRPTLPDFLPAIGPLPDHPRVLAAFGHHHVGLTTAAVTGEIVRDLVLGTAPVVDPQPYAPGRFV